MKLTRSEKKYGYLGIAILFLFFGGELAFFNRLPVSKDELVFYEGVLLSTGRTAGFKGGNSHDYAKIVSEGEILAFDVFVEPHQLQRGTDIEAYVDDDWLEGKAALELKANNVVLYSFPDMREKLQETNESSRKYGWLIMFAGLFFVFKVVTGSTVGDRFLTK